MNCNNKFPVECKKEVYLAGVLGIEANGIVHKPDENGIIKMADVSGPGYEVVTTEIAQSQRVTTGTEPAELIATLPVTNPDEIEVTFDGQTYTVSGENGVYQTEDFTITLGETATITAEAGIHTVEVSYESVDVTDTFAEAVNESIQALTYEEVMAEMEADNG